MFAASLKLCIKKVLWRTFPRLFNKLVTYSGQVFSIGVFSGQDPFHLSSPGDITNPVLTRDSVTDEPAAFVADPFMCHSGSNWYMFFEIMSKFDRLGKIGMASSRDGTEWNYEGKVLEEKFHLAYPHVFQWGEKFYMIPDTPGHGVRLYEAASFPEKWQYVATILDGLRFVDSSIFRFNDDWWLFTASSPTPNAPKSLHLFYSDSPLGDWVEHPLSPVVEENDSIARPGGRVRIIDGCPVRFAQQGVPFYGSSVRAFRVVELSTDSYKEVEVQTDSVLSGSGSGWNAEGMHHMDAHCLENGNWIACVDGWHFPSAS
jgi:hypothetical protein